MRDLFALTCSGQGYATRIPFRLASTVRGFVFFILRISYGLRHRLSYITRWRGFKFTLTFGSQTNR